MFSRIALYIAIAIAVLMALFPPWQCRRTMPRDMGGLSMWDGGYHLAWASVPSCTVDVGRLFVQLLFLAFITLCFFYLFKIPKTK
jgi:hypothetical protein